jgi:DNA modification methylase
MDGKPEKTSDNVKMLKIKQVEISKLIPYAKNSRTHSEAQIAQIAASIREFGFTNPILIDEKNSIIAGHGRLLAARLLEYKKVPCITLTDLSDIQKQAYIIADNKLALNAGWDEEMLSLELKDLNEMDFDLELTGFDGDELDDLLNLGNKKAGLTDDDKVPDPPEVPNSCLGDIWVMGNHRLMCGDSTSVDAVEALMDGQKADMVFTDPPYGMSYGGDRAKGDDVKFKRGGGIKAHGEIIGDDLRGDALLEMVRDAITSEVTVKKDGAAAYVCFTWRTYSEFEAALRTAGLEAKACIVWDKKSIGLGYSNYRPQHEFIFYCDGQWHGEKNESDVWYMSRGATGEYVHPTQKPVELVERAIKNSSKSGDIILDVFGGSGSTAIASEKTGRNSRLMELDPKYCDVIICRWQDYTGEDAILESTGKTYNDTKAREVA